MSVEHEDGAGGTLEHYESRGMRARPGFGDRPCVAVIDFQYGFTDPECPLGSDHQDEPIRVAQRVLEAARRTQIPIVYTRVAYKPSLVDAGRFIEKVPSLGWLVEGSRWVEIDDRVKPEDGDYLLTKRHSSAFIGTELQQVLQLMRVDTVVSVGCSTSGCVRQTAVDANAYGFRSIVVSDAVGDRSWEQHRANLVDLDGKYADVMTSGEVIAEFEKKASDTAAGGHSG